MPAKKKTTAAPESTALVNFRQQLRERLAEAKDTVDAPSGGGFISTKGKTFTLPDGSSSDEPMRVIVLDYVNSFSYFEGAYNPKAPQKPVCSAVGRIVEDMAPLEDSETPQADACQGCPQNEFPADGPKPCKQSFSLAIVAPDSVDTADPVIYRINASPGARKFWSRYVLDLSSKNNLSPVEVITQISLADDVAYPSLRFSLVGPNPKVEQCALLYENAGGILLGRAQKAKAGA